MHADSHTLCLLHFEDAKNPWKDDCGNIFTAVTGSNGGYPKVTRERRLNGRHSLVVDGDGYIVCTNLSSFDPNSLQEWTIDFWLSTSNPCEVDVNPFSFGYTGVPARGGCIQFFFNLFSLSSARLTFMEKSTSMGWDFVESERFVHYALVKRKVSETEFWLWTYCDGICSDKKRITDLFKFETQDLKIGLSTNADSNNRYFIDEFRVSDYARYTTDEYNPDFEKDREYDIFRPVEFTITSERANKQPTNRDVRFTFKDNKAIEVNIERKVSFSFNILHPLQYSVFRDIRFVFKNNNILQYPLIRNVNINIKSASGLNGTITDIRRIIEKKFNKNNGINYNTKREVFLLFNNNNSGTDKNNPLSYHTNRKITINLSELNNKIPKLDTVRKIEIGSNNKDNIKPIAKYDLSRNIKYKVNNISLVKRLLSKNMALDLDDPSKDNRIKYDTKKLIVRKNLKFKYDTTRITINRYARFKFKVTAFVFDLKYTLKPEYL